MMTPEQKIKHSILHKYFTENDIALPVITEDTIDDLYDENIDDLGDTEYEFRSGDEETDIPCDYSRHYESQSVAAKMVDGSWVGWTYWYGGGKHGEPQSMPWMEEAYDLDIQEEEKLVVIRTFTKKE
jgi:hypothetical protein